MASQYIIFENQQLLWKAIQSSPLFGTANLGAVSKYDWFKSIIHRFYRQLVDSNVKSLSRPALQELNKRTISYMIADMKSRVTNDKMYKPPPAALVLPKPETIVREGSIRAESLDKHFSNRQQEYSNYLQPPPPEIDFRMIEKDEPITNLDNLIQQHMNDRERDLQVYVPKPITESLNNTNNNIKISIEESIDNTVLQVSTINDNSKSVSWKPNITNDTTESRNDVDDDAQRIQIFKEEIRKEFDIFKEEIRAFLRPKLDTTV